MINERSGRRDGALDGSHAESIGTKSQEAHEPTETQSLLAKKLWEFRNITPKSEDDYTKQAALREETETLIQDLGEEQDVVNLGYNRYFITSAFNRGQIKLVDNEHHPISVFRLGEAMAKDTSETEGKDSTEVLVQILRKYIKRNPIQNANQRTEYDALNSQIHSLIEKIVKTPDAPEQTKKLEDILEGVDEDLKKKIIRADEYEDSISDGIIPENEIDEDLRWQDEYTSICNDGRQRLLKANRLSGYVSLGNNCYLDTNSIDGQRIRLIDGDFNVINAAEILAE